MNFTTIRHGLTAALVACVAVLAPMTASAQTLDRFSGNDTFESRNKTIVANFYEQFFNKHDLNAATTTIRPDYIQHNPTLTTGRQAFIDLFKSLFVQAPLFHSQIVRMAAEGDLVWVQHHQTSSPGAAGLEIVDLYRLQDGRIAEHWDSIVPVSTNPANTNTQF